jgi:hypothetical protein
VIFTSIKSFCCFHLYLWFRHLSEARYWSSSWYDVVWFFVLLRYLFSSYWNIIFNQLQIQSIIWASTLQLRKHGHSDHFNFIILFVSILPLYAINLYDVILFCRLFFFIFLLLVFDVLYQLLELINIIIFIKKKSRNPHLHLLSTNKKKLKINDLLKLWTYDERILIFINSFK